MSRIPFAVLPSGGRWRIRNDVGQLFAGANLAEIGIGHGAVSRKRLGDRKWSSENCADIDHMKRPATKWRSRVTGQACAPPAPRRMTR